MKIVSSEAMTRIDRRSQEEFAIPSTALMEDAGVKAWAVLRRRVWHGRPDGRIVFAAGRGNNGGDAFVMARQAATEGFPSLSIILAAGRPEPGSDPGRNLASCEALGIEILEWSSRADVAIKVLKSI